MAAIDFPTATSNGQTFEADSGVIYTYVGTPPNGFWSGTFGTTGLITLDGRYIAKNDSNTIQTIQTQGLKFNSGSADTILIDGLNGRIGIGTTTTSGASTYYDDLVINNTASGTGSGITLLANASNGFSAIDFADTDAVGRGRITYSHAVDNLIIDVAGIEAARIDSSGRLLLGTTTEGYASADNFTVADSGNCGVTIRSGAANLGTIAFSDATSGAGEYNGYIQYSQASTYMAFATNENERMRIDGSGNVGIGTNNPLVPFVISDTNRNIEMGYSSGTTSHYIQAYNRATSSYTQLDLAGSVLTFKTPTESMRIDSSGRLGIGTTYPANKLVVSKGGAEGFEVDPGSVTNNNILLHYNRSGSVYVTAEHRAAAHVFEIGASEAARIDSSGNVGIGNINPSHRLSIAGTANNVDSEITITAISVASAYIGANANGLNLGTDTAGIVFKTGVTGGGSVGSTGTERMRIDSSGRLLVGTSSGSGEPIAAFQGRSNDASDSAIVAITRTGTNPSGSIGELRFATGSDFNKYYGMILCASDGSTSSTSLPGALRFSTTASGSTSPTERMRLDSAGSLLHGRTTPYHSGAGPEILALQGDRNGMVIFNTTNLNYYLITLRSQYANNNNNGLAGTYLIFQDQGGTVRGSIVVGTSTAYNTTSDYRQKENIANLTGAIDRVKDLSPKRFNWIGRPSSEQIDGFIAHEAQAVVPQAVTGTKDEVDDDGNAVMQGIDQSKLVPLLTAALQESIAKIETLELPNKNPINIKQTTSLLNNPFITFLNSSGDTAGSIIQNGVNSVTYATSSDYRLKDNVVELTSAIPRLKQLAPKRFNFTAAADVTVDGFLAHEAQAVVPEAVTGSHNQVDGDGNPVMQGIDQSKLVPLLTAALQEAIGRIETLETRIAALEGS